MAEIKSKFEEKNEGLKKYLDQIIKSANDAIIISDIDGKILYFNDRALEYYQYTPQEFSQLNLTSLFNEELNFKWEQIVNEIRSKKGILLETTHKKKNGEEFPVQVSISFVELGLQSYIIQIIRDFTERRLIEAELQTAKQKAEESDKLKSNFLSMMSHEVRTPINIILGAVDMIQNSLPPDVYSKNEMFFEMITRNSKRLLTLISDIIDISRIESNEMKLNFIIRNAESIILDLISEYEHLAKNKGLKIVTDFNSTNAFLRIDEIRFIQIMSNLITNAIKFTNKGGIIISTKNVDKTLHISVKDTGIGIPKEALNDIFGMFRQAHEGYGRKYEGAGLGLTIVQKLTKMMGGEIFVQSELGKGTIFTVVFPVSEHGYLEEDLSIQIDEERFKKDKPFIVLVSDNKEEIFYLESLMIKFGVNYYTINNGFKLFQILKQSRVDLVIYSIDLQEEETAEKFIHELRNNLKMDNVKVLAIKSANTIGDEKRYLALGFNKVMVKPFSFEELAKVVFELWKNNGN